MRERMEWMPSRKTNTRDTQTTHERKSKAAGRETEPNRASEYERRDLTATQRQRDHARHRKLRMRDKTDQVDKTHTRQAQSGWTQPRWSTARVGEPERESLDL
ncbi:hypothetical protein C8Q70DRAFT_216340 [Cubamyces menziesii]|nr:hypothetical protein C8Q70DRAFT_216340 [Cubamyces menziesii]